MSDLGRARRNSLENRRIPVNPEIIRANDELRRATAKFEEDRKNTNTIIAREDKEMKILRAIHEGLIENDNKEYTLEKERITNTYQEEVANIRSDPLFAQYPQNSPKLLKKLKDDFSKEVKAMDKAFAKKMQSRESAFTQIEYEQREKHRHELSSAVRKQHGWTEPST